VRAARRHSRPARRPLPADRAALARLRAQWVEAGAALADGRRLTVAQVPDLAGLLLAAQRRAAPLNAAAGRAAPVVRPGHPRPWVCGSGRPWPVGFVLAPAGPAPWRAVLLHPARPGLVLAPWHLTGLGTSRGAPCNA
jgi:hypothetical protein